MFAFLSFIKFLDWFESTVDITLFKTQFVISFLLLFFFFFFFFLFYLPGTSQTDDPGKNKKKFVNEPIE